MRFPWANALLLFLLVFQLVTGVLGLVNGSAALSWTLRLHDIGGYAIVALLAFKSLIILDVFNRVRRLSMARLAFAALLVLLLFVLATGVIWPFLGYTAVAGLSLMTIHVLLVFAIAALLLWHVLARRFVFKHPQTLERRTWLRLAGLGLAGLFFSQTAEAAFAVLKLPGARRRFTGSFEQSSYTGKLPVVSWLFDFPPPIDRDRWTLTIDGEVDRPIRLTSEEVERLAVASTRETLDCTGGWYSTQDWTGVPLGRLLEMAGVRETAQSVTVQAVSGYARRFSLEEASGCLLANKLGGEPLTHGHGAPMRLVAPGQRGFNWVKWITRIHVNDTSAALQTPVPLQ